MVDPSLLFSSPLFPRVDTSNVMMSMIAGHPDHSNIRMPTVIVLAGYSSGPSPEPATLQMGLQRAPCSQGQAPLTPGQEAEAGRGEGCLCSPQAADVATWLEW